MKDFTGLVLCNYRSERVDVHVTASVVGGKLTFSCQDLGPFVEETFGDSDYEYWYTFDQENTEKLFSVIHGEENPEGALLRDFSGESGCRKMREVCEENGIEYGFYSYV